MAASGESPQESAATALPGLVACSPAMQEIVRIVRRVADTQAPILIHGEPGVGKGTLAEAIHHASDRRGGPFARLDCSVVSPQDFSGDLFETKQGTLYLAELDRLSPESQTRLLRILQQESAPPAHSSLPEGSSLTEGPRLTVEARLIEGPRLIAASCRELQTEVDAGKFRGELYWWLNVVPLEIPPLRSRIEDIPALVRHFLDRSNARHGRRLTGVARRALDALQAYAWPGNGHELRTYVDRAVVMADVMADGDELNLELFPEAISGIAPIRSGGLSRFDLGSLTEEVVAQGIATVAEDDPNPGLHSRIVDSVERELMVQVLRGCNGVRTQAAARLGINRNTLHKKIKEYGLDTESPDGSGS